MKALIFIILTSLFISACNTGGDGVKILTSGINAPLLFEVDGQNGDGRTLDLGEHLLTDEPRQVISIVHNSSNYPYTDLDLTMTADGDDVTSMNFLPTLEGETAFPGYGGTCGRTLPPGMSCSINLVFSPRESRAYLETLTLNFKNFVEAETHIAKLQFIAGTPASLAFTSDITQYNFGTLVGAANTPVVERAEISQYKEEMEIVNAGGLSAKNILTTLTESCISVLSNTCPTDMFGAYTMDNNCPTELAPGEKCKITVYYSPKNQDPVPGPTPDDIKEINYRSTLNLAYIRDPNGGNGALNGYFRSVSTNIEARFRVSQTAINFDQTIVSGNRDIRTVRANNIGYREGVIKYLALRDSGGTLIANCRAVSGKSFLECRNPGNTILDLAALPFAFKDRSNCILAEKEVPVGEGCIFDIVFQPSVTYLTDKPTEFLDLQPEVIYDSRLKGVENLVTQKLFNLSAKSKAAARLIVDRLVFDSKTYPVAGTGPWTVDLEKITLQSSNFITRKPMIVTFKNVGSVEATGISIRDGLNTLIPLSGSGTTLGPANPKFYASVIGNESTCSVIPPGATCSITILFAAIGMNTSAEEEANMFDSVVAGIKYKNFITSYSSGSLYTDTNLDSTPDYPAQTSTALVTATLLRKGMLLQLADDTRNVSNIGNGYNVAGATYQSHLYLRNIGTGDVPYIRLLNPTIAGAPVYHGSLSIVPTVDPVSLGADYDCLGMVDIDFTYSTPNNAQPASRLGNFTALPREKSCVFTLQYKSADKFKYRNPMTCNDAAAPPSNYEEGIRYFSRQDEAAGGADLWQFCQASSTVIYWNNVSIDYYDGDLSDPALPYGSRFSLANYNYQANQSSAAKLLPYYPMPWITATIYRPGFSVPANSAKAGYTVPAYWFYGISTAFYFVKDDPAQASPFIQGDESRNYVTTLASFADAATHDYVLYVGAVPQGSPNVTFPVYVRNFGYGSTRLQVTSITRTANTAFTNVSMPSAGSMPLNIGINSNVGSPMSFRLNSATTTPGEKAMTLEIDYDSGFRLDPLIYKSNTTPSNAATAAKKSSKLKILVIADVLATGTYPKLAMSVEDYDVVQNNNAPPTVTIGAPYTANLNWNTNPLLTTLVYDSVKLQTAPTANDAYAQKRITFTNDSTVTISKLNVGHRPDINSSSIRTMPSSYKINSSTCTANTTLAPGASCSMIVKYQPVTSDSTENVVMSVVYSSPTSQMFMQSVGVNLTPRAPGTLTAVGVTLESINYKVSSSSSSITRSSYPLNFNILNFDTDPLIIDFKDASGTYKKLTMVNLQSTKASLLLSYQKYLSENSLRGYSPSTPAPNTVVPDVSEYVTIDGNDYAPIHLIKYTNGTERISVKATKGCFFGDDENNGAILSYQKGFNSTTSAANPCYLAIKLTAGYDYILKTINIANGDDMRENAFELWYFSVNRSSTSSFWVHLKGSINPDLSLASGNFTDVHATDTLTADFRLPLISANNVNVGNLVGLRVLMSTSAATLNSPYSLGIVDYVDVRPYSYSALQAVFNSGLLNGNYHYFRVVGIRRHTSFNHSSRFNGLGANEYLSASTSPNTLLTLLVPPVGHHYFHDNKLLVEKTLTGGVAYDPYDVSVTKCNSKNAVSLKTPSVININYGLINKATWNLLLTTPEATSYSNMDQTAHWTSDPAITVDSAAGSLPGFIANNSSQILSSSSVFYVRNSGDFNLPVYQAVGGVPGTTFSNYYSYIDAAVGYGSTRCMVHLP